MGLFDAFKKKKEEPAPHNNPNSVFTLRFTIPFFSVFDKTNPKLRAFPVKLSCAGSVQYRIADPTLCFDNIPLASMSAGQLEEHVKDSLHAAVKHFINSIDYMPILQFETELMRINDAAKQYLVPQFADEYGINLRTFNLTAIRYDEEDANYQRLYAQSAATADKLGNHEIENLEMDHEDDLYEREHRRRLRNLRDNEDLVDRENNLRLRQQAGEHALRRNESQLNREDDSANIDIERKRREMEEDMYARRKATDSGARLADSLGKREMPGLGNRPAPGLGKEKPSSADGLDLGSL
ncbi:MAG: hypothetical protein HDS00_03685 [Bacteroides sp.]|nr:hypothetical protein [Bacteroides sp.]